MMRVLTRPIVPLLFGIILGELTCKQLGYFTTSATYLIPFLIFAVFGLCKAGEFPSIKISFIFFAIGFCLGGYRLHSVRFPDVSFEKAITIEGTVYTYTKKSWSDDIFLGDISIGGRKPFSQKVQIHIKGSARGKIKRGDRIRIRTKLEDSKESPFPNISSMSNFLWVQDIIKIGQISEVEILQETSCPYLIWLNKVKKDITSFLESNIKQPNLGFFESIVVGNRTKLQSEMKETLIKNGIYHIVAVSGLHFGLVAWFIFVISKQIINMLPNIIFFPLCRLIRPSTINCLVSIPCLFILGDIVCWRSSTMRAFIMLTTYMICEAWDIQSTISERIALSEVILLLLYPKELFGIGFILSYTIVFFISTALSSSFTTSITRFCNSEEKTLLVESVLVSSVACIVFIPLSAYFFSRVALISFASNTLVLPIFSGVIILLACSTVMFFITPSLAVFPLSLAKKSSDIAFQSLRIFERLPNISFWVSPPETWLVICFLFAFYLLLREGKESRWVYGLVTANIILSSILFYSLYPKQSTPIKENIEFFNNRGLGITFINSNTRKVLIFEGKPGIRSNFIFSKFAKSLLNRGIDSIDCLVVPKFNMKQLNSLIKINEIFHIREAVFFSHHSQLSEDILSHTADKLRFITCNNFSKNMTPHSIYDKLKYRFLSKDGNLAICYQSSNKKFLFYYGKFRKNNSFWKGKNIYGVKLPKVFPKKELVRIIDAYKPKIIIFPRSYKRYGIKNKTIKMINIAKTGWARMLAQ